ncbi:MAG: thiamine phosphate synthase [Candidatus Mcinerneyibacterium aminivorans]|jgi:thiamine-phosphate pyrophosphorylase|uniref:Thiamine-phosphate synthase n=1 Tax=Candidatus Mcinerneyibacterium aminivorans TaxID=2703815 RepID=A0A5D0MJS5_9BACT|nr:MAG: thiamine phosphate synthase [Candidatus Mcinerneyibacterium aminivorans]
MKNERINNWKLYLVTEEILSIESTEDIVRKAVDAGIDVIQLREKNKTKKEKYKLGLKIKKIIGNKNISFLVNDDIDIALALNADGVHLGNNDLPVKVARKLLGNKKIIGKSTHSLQQSIKAEKDGADYIGYGSVFDTSSKKLDDKRKSLGLELLEEIKNNINLPIVAIGGIKLENVKKVIEAGAISVAVISAITQSKNIGKKIIRFNKIIKNNK